MEWIPCRERLPDENGEYFVTFIWDMVRCTSKMNFYRKDCYYKWIWDKYNFRDMTYNVIAWMSAEPYLGDNI